MRSDIGASPKIYMAPSPRRPKAALVLLWGKGNDQILGGLLDTGSELTLLPEDPNCHCGPPLRVGPMDVKWSVECQQRSNSHWAH